MISGPRTYDVSRAARQPLVEFMVAALKQQGCRILYRSDTALAPFIITFETLGGERFGIVAYAFLATRTPTKNRPTDERSFQVKYGSKHGYRHRNSHDIWQDPLGLFTTLFVGISLEENFFVSADAEMHNPTKFFIRIEFKDEHADQVLGRGWHAWERDRRDGDEPVEVLVGARAEHFLDLIRFERAAKGLDQGNRQLLAERPAIFAGAPPASSMTFASTPAALHPLIKEFELTTDEVLDLIAGARRLKMAVRGWVAEEHLRETLAKTPGITRCERLDVEGGPDLRVCFRGGPPLTVECKNVLRAKDKNGHARVDFQRTRASKADPCSRYYYPADFDVVAACLHAVTERWEFRYALPRSLAPHAKCVGRLASNVVIGDLWNANPGEIFEAAYASV